MNLLHTMLHAANIQARPVLGELFDWKTQTNLTGFFTPTSGSLAFEIAGFMEEIDLIAVVDLDQFDPGNEPVIANKEKLNWKGNLYLLRSQKSDLSAYTLGFKMIGPAVYPPAITSPLAASGNVGTPFSYFITATNSPDSYSATGLPDGLTVNEATGEISGTPTGVAVTTATVGASNIGGSGTAPLVITIDAPVIGEMVHILVVGQSNALGINATPILTDGEATNGRMFVGGMVPGGTAPALASLVPLQEETVTAGGETGVVALVNWLAAQAEGNTRLYLVSNAAQDAACYGAIAKGTQAYLNHMTQVAAAKSIADGLGLTYRVLCVIGIHGECDEGFSNTSYGANLLTWQSDYESDCQAISGQSEAIPMFQVAQGAAGALQYNSGNLLGSSAIQLQIAAAANSTKLIHVGPEDHLDFYAHPHFNAAGHAWLGEQFAKLIQQVCFDGDTNTTITPTVAVVSGSTIVVDFLVPFEPLQIDHDWCFSSDDCGFSFTSSDGTVLPTSVEVTAPNQLTLTFAAPLSGTGRAINYAIDASTPKVARTALIVDSDPRVSQTSFDLRNRLAPFTMETT